MSKTIRLGRVWGMLTRILMLPYRLWQWTRTINIAIFFGVYLMAIPVFAGLFTYMRFEFHHTTSKYETDTLIQANRVSSILTDVIRANLTTGTLYTIDRLHVTEVKPDGDKVFFRIFVRLKPMFFPRVIVLDAEMNGRPWNVMHDANGSTSVVVLRLVFPYKRDRWLVEQIPRALEIFTVVDESDRYQDILVDMPFDNHLEIEALLFAAQGCPGYISGTFGRMLYLSACTITTLGYGDIVPTSSTTRALVGSEAVLGIVLMGLFLGSATYGKGRSNGSPREAKSGGKL